jgi:hypothetical protein
MAAPQVPQGGGGKKVCPGFFERLWKAPLKYKLLFTACVIFIAVLGFYQVWPQLVGPVGFLKGLWFWPYLAGLVVIAIFLGILGYCILGRGKQVRQLFVGHDGRMSSSLFQIFVWTLVILFAYVAVFSKYLLPISGIPGNILTALGLSIVTATAAKGIASTQANNTVVKVKKEGPPKISELFEDDEGKPDLGKSQMLAWTFIAVGVYLFGLFGAIQSGSVVQTDGSVALPDIDSTLMVLMGLGQAAYIGTKLTTANAPQVTGLSIGAGKPGVPLTIHGSSFGGEQKGSLITFDGRSSDVIPSQWSDTDIILSVPEKIPGHPDIPTGGLGVDVGVVVAGVGSNKVPFTVLPKGP